MFLHVHSRRSLLPLFLPWKWRRQFFLKNQNRKVKHRESQSPLTHLPLQKSSSIDSQILRRTWCSRLPTRSRHSLKVQFPFLCQSRKRNPTGGAASRLPFHAQNRSNRNLQRKKSWKLKTRRHRWTKKPSH